MRYRSEKKLLIVSKTGESSRKLKQFLEGWKFSIVYTSSIDNFDRQTSSHDMTIINNEDKAFGTSKSELKGLKDHVIAPNNEKIIYFYLGDGKFPPVAKHQNFARTRFTLYTNMMDSFKAYEIEKLLGN